MLKKKSVNQFAWAALAFVSVMPAAMSQAGAARSQRSVQRVVDAMGLAGLVVGSDQVEFLAGIASPGETVRVVSVSDSRAGTVKVKLRCLDSHECLPFYVLVHGVLVHGVLVPSLDKVNVGGEKHAVPIEKATSLQNIIRGGDRATLTLETQDSRMSFPVICLQSGVRGQRVRAASPDHRQFFDAEVVAPGMLRGSL
jgi:hypothetical protein